MAPMARGCAAGHLHRQLSYALVNPWRESWLLSLLAELGLVSY
jgi:hypothetical protein